ncbi:hypothetical protein CJU90_3957 [Yarrowia sp. C11]|nr:hypothetical protein CJU90_3957 [Yarrowia sp. C11]
MDRIKSLEKRVGDTKTNIANYVKLRDTLTAFPHELYRPIRIPTPGGFEMEGVVENTNKIITLVGDGWLVEKSAFGALRVVDERLAILEQNLKAYEEALETAKFDKEGLPVFEIREELDDKGNVVSSSVEEFDTGKAANLRKFLGDKMEGEKVQDQEEEEEEEDQMDTNEDGLEEMDTVEDSMDDFDGSLPMMEIREELDDDGNIIESKVEEAGAGNKDTDEIEKHLKLLNELAKKKLDKKSGPERKPGSDTKSDSKPVSTDSKPDSTSSTTKPIYGPPPPTRKVGGGIFRPQLTPGVLRQQSPKIEEIDDDENEEENKTEKSESDKSGPSNASSNIPTVTDVTEDDSSDSLSSLQSSNSSISSNPAVAPESLLELELLADDAMDEEEDDLEADDEDWDFEDDDFDDMEADEDDHGRTRGSMFPGMSQDQLRSIMEGRKAAAAESKPPVSDIVEKPMSIVSDITESPLSASPSPTPTAAPKSSLKSASSRPKSVSFSNNLHIKRIPNKETIKNQERQEMKKQQQKQSRFKQELSQRVPEPEDDDEDEDEDEDDGRIKMPTVSDIAERAAPETPASAPAPQKKMSRFMLARMGKEEAPKQSRDSQSHDQTNPKDGRVLRGMPSLGSSGPTIDKDIADYTESMKLTPRPPSQGHGHAHGHVRSRAISGHVPAPEEEDEPVAPSKVYVKAPVSGLALEKEEKEAVPEASDDKEHDDAIMREVMSYLAENEDEEAFEQLHQDMDESKLAEELYRQRAQNHNAAVQRGLDSMADVDVVDGDDDDMDMDLDDDMADAGARVDDENDENAQVLNDIVENDHDDPEKDIIHGDLDMDPAVHRREVAEHYYRLRNNMVAKNGGFMQTDGEKASEECDENAAPIKVSRFKAARMNRQ